MKKFYKAKNDSMFKAIFCDPQNKDLLEELLVDCLRRKVEVMEIYPPEIIKNNIYVKGKTLDVLVKAGDEIINIEINSDYYSSMHRRNALYIFTKYAEEAKIGDNYSKMRNFIQINLTSGIAKEKPLKLEYILIDIETKNKFIDNLTILEYNVKKIKEICYNEKEKEYKFIAALDCNKEELKTICGGNKVMEKFEKKVNTLNDDIEFTQFLTAEEDMEKLKATLKSEWQEEALAEGHKKGHESGFNQGIEEGRKEGRKEGIKEGIQKGFKQGVAEEKNEIAKVLIKRNIDLKDISETTGLSITEIKGLR